MQFTNILREEENLRKSILHVEFTRLKHNILRKVGNYTMQFINILREVGNLYSPTLINIAEMEQFFITFKIFN